MTLAKPHKAKGIACEPYQALARIYDGLMSHIDYQRWSEFIVQLLMQEPDWPQDLLELACGTGTVAGYLTNYGLQVTGMDRSRAMIEQARMKNTGDNPDFVVAGFEDFPLVKQYKAVICLYDSVNYLLKFDELVSFLVRVKQVLLPGGVFIFDICTRYNSRMNFVDYEDSGTIGAYHFHRFSNYNSFTHKHTNDFEISNADSRRLLFREYHVQHIYSKGQVISAIKKAGLKPEDDFDDMNHRKAHPQSLRVHFLCRRLP